jgi:hypothetical protein
MPLTVAWPGRSERFGEGKILRARHVDPPSVATRPPPSGGSRRRPVSAVADDGRDDDPSAVGLI